MDGANPVDAWLADLVERIRPLTGGSPATYIPELGKVDPGLFGIAVAMVDGTIHAAGDFGRRFTIQSISKAFVYGHALDRLGRARVLAHVGVEPTGEGFNAISLDEKNNRPFNPMVNSGAIATTELIEGDTPEQRQAALAALMARFAGRRLPLDEAVYLSEKATGHRNRAIAWMMLNAGMIHREPEELLDLYFRQCSLLVDARDLAMMGATIANDGLNPRTGVRALAAGHVPDVLTVMNMCGMYNYAGQWSYEIGLPAKSGVSGAILMVVPGQAGIAIYSPPLDGNGNSVRGVAAAHEIARAFGLHIFATHPSVRNVVRAEYRGDRIRSKRARGHAALRLLQQEGARIRVLEAQGALYFGSTERLIRRASELAVQADHLILDLRRVISADVAACRLLAGLIGTLAARETELIFAHVEAEGPLASLHAAILAGDGDGPGAIASSRDAALERCEDRLIAARGGTPARASSFAELDILRGLDPAALALVEPAATCISIAPGDVLVQAGGAAHAFIAIASGSASVRLPPQGQAGPATRGESFGPGMSCGELALLDHMPAPADIVADEEVRAYVFDIATLKALGDRHPQILARIAANIAFSLSDRLRAAHREIRALER